LLIDGGGSSYTGQRYVDGWLNLIEELSEGGMGYGGGSIYTVDDAIEKVCNHADYNNNYDFQSTCYYYNDASGIPTDWNVYTSEIEDGRPFVYQFRGYVTVDTSGGTPAYWWTDHAVAGIGYKTTGSSSTQKWRIIHYNSSIVDDPCYMCEADMNIQYSHIVKIVPGGGFSLTMSGPTSLDEYENGTFTANVSGVVSPFSYTWYRMEGFDEPDKDEKPDDTKRPPVGVWIYHSSGSSSAVSNGVSPGFKMKCVVEDDVGYEKEVIKTIHVSKDKSKKIVSDSNQGIASPSEYILSPNFPNPFNPETSIHYSLPKKTFVNLSIYDVGGRLICVLVDEEQSAGFYKCTWNGTDNTGTPVTSGLYIGLIKAGEYTEKIKMMLVR